MPLAEFDLIREFFSHSAAGRDDVVLGVGDDCALLQPPVGMELAVTSDTLVEGVHFTAGADPEALGHKSLAVNLSDLAAMGAEPAWVSLALTLPSSNSDWLQAFSRGFLSLAKKHGVALIGGDTTSGPLSISVTAHGFVRPGTALRRSGASAGDQIYVTGTLGDAALALLARQGSYAVESGMAQLEQRLDRPQPRLAVGLALGQIATAAIDISDGLLSDLGHICASSGVGARVLLEMIPTSAQVRSYLQQGGEWGTVVAAGDDYELCLTIPPGKDSLLRDIKAELDCDLVQVGEVVLGSGVTCIDSEGRTVSDLGSGYQHFR
ncbi:MAG: thiamine-phosphate kinase [Gammaproteobacteria bacterium]|nr:thiamine-phosphate kinase [Gammaproteobacteria bacterium]